MYDRDVHFQIERLTVIRSIRMLRTQHTTMLSARPIDTVRIVRDVILLQTDSFDVLVQITRLTVFDSINMLRTQHTRMLLAGQIDIMRIVCDMILLDSEDMIMCVIDTTMPDIRRSCNILT